MGFYVSVKVKRANFMTLKIQELNQSISNKWRCFPFFVIAGSDHRERIVSYRGRSQSGPNISLKHW